MLKPSTVRLIVALRHLNFLMDNRWCCAQYLKGVRKSRRPRAVVHLVHEAAGYWLGL